jgi:hypothetical protein
LTTVAPKKQVSTRIRLDYTSDEHTDLAVGDFGTITGRRQDPWGEVVDVQWDNGSSLSLVSGEDLWTRVVDD